MGRHGIRYITALSFLGTVLMLITYVGMIEKQWREDRAVVADMLLRMESMDGEVGEKQLKIAKWYNWSLEQGNYVPDWDYGNILNLGEGRMGLLRVPQLGFELPITHGIGGTVGHDPASALPVGGGGDHTVLYIDRGAPWREGMTVETVLPGMELTWEVVRIQVMPGQWPPDHPADGPLLTLVWDREETRTIIRCRISSGTEETEESPLKEAIWGGMLPLFAVPASCILGRGLLFLYFRRQKRKKLPN